jgi:hypothetical protein
MMHPPSTELSREEPYVGMLPGPCSPSAAHRNYPRQFGGGICRIVRVFRSK